jgi:BlaI family transcriptional regulator, penicillinase repressor
MSNRRTNASTSPTHAELEILAILWRRGPSTVRQVHEILQADRRATGMTTTLKILQLMTDKRLTTRTDSRPQLYAPAKPAARTQSSLLKDFVRKAFDGSIHKLMIRAVEDGNLKPEELDQIQQLIDKSRKPDRGEK